MIGLIEKLDALKTDFGAAETNTIRAKQIGTGMRGDKTRTYRFRDDQIEDHVTGKRTTCKRFMRGEIDRLW